MAWYNEPRRHALSAKGIKTAITNKPQAFTVVKAPSNIKSSFQETPYSTSDVEKYISKKYNNGDFDYYLVMSLIDFEEATGDKINGKKYVVEIKAVSPSQVSAEKKKSIGESLGVDLGDDKSVDLKGMPEKDQAVEIEEYGISALLYQEEGNDKEELLRKAREQEQIIPGLFGFYMDRPQNAIGATGWDFIKGDYGIERYSGKE